MFFSKVKHLSKYLGIIGGGIVVGAIFTGVSIKLPMLIEATWTKEERHFVFDSRSTQLCQATELLLEKTVGR